MESTQPHFECVVLAGGLGTRLRHIVPGRPKALAPVAGRPFLDILLHLLIAKGCTRFVLSVGHMADQIMGRYGNVVEDVSIAYVREQSPLGTGGGVRLALRACESPAPLVVNGDTLADFDAAAVLAIPESNNLPVIVGKYMDNAERYGLLRVEGNTVTAFTEKNHAGPGCISVGCYRIPRNALEHFADGQVFSLEQDYLAPLAAQSPLPLCVTTGLFIDIGVPDDYARAQTLLHSHAEGIPLPRGTRNAHV